MCLWADLALVLGKEWTGDVQGFAHAIHWALAALSFPLAMTSPAALPLAMTSFNPLPRPPHPIFPPSRPPTHTPHWLHTSGQVYCSILHVQALLIHRQGLCFVCSISRKQLHKQQMGPQKTSRNLHALSLENTWGNNPRLQYTCAAHNRRQLKDQTFFASPYGSSLLLYAGPYLWA